MITVCAGPDGMLERPFCELRLTTISSALGAIYLKTNGIPRPEATWWLFIMLSHLKKSWLVCEMGDTRSQGGKWYGPSDINQVKADLVFELVISMGPLAQSQIILKPAAALFSPKDSWELTMKDCTWAGAIFLPVKLPLLVRKFGGMWFMESSQ